MISLGDCDGKLCRQATPILSTLVIAEWCVLKILINPQNYGGSDIEGCSDI